MILNSEFWQKWEKNAKAPNNYDPPQFEAGWFKTCYCINWYTASSPLGTGFPCCMSDCLLSCIQPDAYVDLSAENTWGPQLMAHINSECPEEYVGIYWLKDHIQPSVLLTIHDANWINPNFVVKDMSTNWVRNADTCYGAMMGCGSWFFNMKLMIQIAPNGDWLHVHPGNHWIYKFKTKTRLVDAQGKPFFVNKGDMMRLNFEKWDDPSSRIIYQYILVKVAHKIQSKIIYDKKNIFDMKSRISCVHDPLFFAKYPKFTKNISNSNYIVSLSMNRE